MILRRRLHRVGILWLAFAAAVGCSGGADPATVPSRPTTTASDAAGVAVVRRDFANVVVIAGEVAEAPAVTVTLPAGATTVATLPGDVAAGALLATVPASTPIAQRRAVEDATAQLGAAERADDLASTPETRTAVAAADLVLTRAREDLWAASAPGATVASPIDGRASVEGGAIVVRPRSRRFVAQAEPMKVYRLGAVPGAASVSVTLPAGTFESACGPVSIGADVAAAGQPSNGGAPDPAAAATGVACTIDGGDALVAGMAAKLSVSSPVIAAALVVPASTIVLDRGSTSSGTVTRVTDGERIPITVVGVDGLSVAIEGAVEEGERLQAYPARSDGPSEGSRPSAAAAGGG